MLTLKPEMGKSANQKHTADSPVKREWGILRDGVMVMPRPETFMDRQIGDRHIRVLKVYDRVYAREVLAEMEKSARLPLEGA